MREVWLSLNSPQDHYSKNGQMMEPPIIIKGILPQDTKVGRNTIVFTHNTIKITEVYWKDKLRDWAIHKCKTPFLYNFMFFTTAQRKERERCFNWLAEVTGLPKEKVSLLHPFLVSLRINNENILFHYMAIERRKCLYVAYYWEYNEISIFEHPRQIIELIKGSSEFWETSRGGFNHSCWYTKWRRDVEIERKYTLNEPTDMWMLVQKMYHELNDGKLDGFIPEFNDEFQVWDFENFLFEIIEPEDKKGYISFIPQSNGLTTVKQKFFNEDTEIRVENITANLELHPTEYEEYARLQGTVRSLPPYRRKRFDINLESLRTGNIYGIFFDLCRLVDDEEYTLFQCEVEYIRSRVMGPTHDVIEEFEQVCYYTKNFLERENIRFWEGYYSKLSFLRDYVKLARK